MGGCSDTDIDPGFVLHIERLTLAGPLNIFVPFLVSWMLGIFCAFIELYIYIYTTRIQFIMVIGLSGVQLNEWMNAKRKLIKTMTKFEFETCHRLCTFINQNKNNSNRAQLNFNEAKCAQQCAHMRLICPVTLSNYKHGAFTVLLVLKSGWR